MSTRAHNTIRFVTLLLAVVACALLHNWIGLALVAAAALFAVLWKRADPSAVK